MLWLLKLGFLELYERVRENDITDERPNDSEPREFRCPVVQNY